VKRRRWSPMVKPVVGTGIKNQPSAYMLRQAAGFVADALRQHVAAAGADAFAHVGCVKAAFHNSGHQNVTPAICECCGEEFIPPCMTCENAFNFAVRELVESGAVALREVAGALSLFVVDREKLDAVPAPKWKVRP
jgi:hypothetical protein